MHVLYQLLNLFTQLTEQLCHMASLLEITDTSSITRLNNRHVEHSHNLRFCSSLNINNHLIGSMCAWHGYARLWAYLEWLLMAMGLLGIVATRSYGLAWIGRPQPWVCLAWLHASMGLLGMPVPSCHDFASVAMGFAGHGSARPWLLPGNRHGFCWADLKLTVVVDLLSV